ncbi:kinesin-like protein KIF9 [Antennarius striatus]|uniref:kinesin-like protein KIF9 n=1 Tax=Antennarius striatus TaxID=241820 RepID=UPI0035B3A665
MKIHHTRNPWKPPDSKRCLDAKRSPDIFTFRMDGVLRDVSQEEFYTQVCRQLVLGAMDGYNGTVMCFGQTGAGKTYTMTGSIESYQQRGIIPRALQEIFQEVKKRAYRSFTVHLSYLEIYNETLVDLLAFVKGLPDPPPGGLVLMDKPNGVFIRGLSVHPVHNEEEALCLLFEGEMNRNVGSHALNRNASRSHCIFTVQIASHSRTFSDGKYVTSRLHLVDMAGSERARKTGTEGLMLKEAGYINRSMSFLEQAIRALAEHQRDHVPFRQSKLTYVLKDSLGGGCNTVFVANIHGEAAQVEETLCTLRFASRMNRIPTNPVLNIHRDPAIHIKILQKEIQMLKDELSVSNKLATQTKVTSEPLSEAQLAEIHNQVQQYLEGNLDQIQVTSIKQVDAAFEQFKRAVHRELEQSQKDRSATKDAMKEWGTTCSADAVEDGGAEVPGQRQSNADQPSSTKSKSKKSGLLKKQGEASPVGKKTKSKSSSAPTPEREQELQEPDTENLEAQEAPRPDNEPPYPGSNSPPKEEAFERFKAGQGSKFNTAFKENKAALLERRSLLQQLREEIDAIKRKTDSATDAMQEDEELRRKRGQSLVMEPDSRPTLQLRELKALYRKKCQVLKDIKAEVNYCQQILDQQREQLITEFESWYKKSFLVPEDRKEGTDYRPDSPGAATFHSARHRMLRRRIGRSEDVTPETSLS